MLVLLAADGARFSGVMQSIGSQIRVSYVVSLELGARVERQRDAGIFPSEERAIAWLQSQASARGFEHFALEWRPPLVSGLPSGQTSGIADKVRETTAIHWFRKI